MADVQSMLQSRVQEAYLAGSPLSIVGGGTKFPADSSASRLEVTQHHGIVEYDPSELVVVVRAGTAIKTLVATLARHNQILGFEPPFVEGDATVGGMVGTGFAGSARPYRGGVRDFVLGAKIINGKGEVLQFGGKVMKNVAGFDLFRPIAGAMGTLGVLLEVSLRLLPRPTMEKAVQFECKDQHQAIDLMSRQAKTATSLSASHWDGARQVFRFSGTSEAVEFDLSNLGKYAEVNLEAFAALDERRHPFFDGDSPIYQCSLPPASSPLRTASEQLIDWGGARRFVKSVRERGALQAEVESKGGAIMLLGSNSFASPLSIIPTHLHAIHKKLKLAFDPAGIFNLQHTLSVS